MSKGDGGPAFPMSGDPNVEFDRGMSLRDYFAGQALAGILAAQEGAYGSVDAQAAYEMADSMLAERAKVPCPQCNVRRVSGPGLICGKCAGAPEKAAAADRAGKAGAGGVE